MEGGGADRLAAAEMGGGEQRLLCMGRPLSVGRHRLTAAPQEHPRHTSAPLTCAHTCAHEFSVCCGCCVECVSVRMQSRGRRDVCARHDGTVPLPPPPHHYYDGLAMPASALPPCRSLPGNFITTICSFLTEINLILTDSAAAAAPQQRLALSVSSQLVLGASPLLLFYLPDMN